VQEEQLKAGLRPGDDGYGVEPKERFGKIFRADYYLVLTANYV
jgi:hypothetical protein